MVESSQNRQVQGQTAVIIDGDNFIVGSHKLQTATKKRLWINENSVKVLDEFIENKTGTEINKKYKWYITAE